MKMNAQPEQSPSTEWGFLTPLDQFASVSDWAADSLDKLRPYSGRIMFLGQLLDSESEQMLISILKDAEASHASA